MLEKLTADLKTSMLARDTARTGVLRMALAAYKNEAVAKGLGPQGELPEADSIALFKRLVKSREDSIEQFTKAGYADRAASEQAEITVLKGYLPAMLEGVQLENAVREAIAQSGAAAMKDMRSVMGVLSAKYGGAIDGKVVSAMASTFFATGNFPKSGEVAKSLDQESKTFDSVSGLIYLLNKNSKP